MAGNKIVAVENLNLVHLIARLVIKGYFIKENCPLLKPEFWIGRGVDYHCDIVYYLERPNIVSSRPEGTPSETFETSH